MKRICSTESELNKQSSNLLQQLMRKGHQPAIKEQIDKGRAEDRMLLLNEKAQEAKHNVPISVTYNRILTKVKKIVE